MSKYREKLLNILDEFFSEEELRTICFDMNVDFDNLPAQGKKNKARELILYLEKHRRISELVAQGKQTRPNISWPETPEEPQSPPVELPRTCFDLLCLILAFIVVAVLIGSCSYMTWREENQQCLHRIIHGVSPGLEVNRYAANGRANIQAICDRTLDGRQAYLQVDLQAYDPFVHSNSGVILALWGLDAKEYTTLSFWVKGEHGGERFGVKMKDNRSTERFVWVTKYLGGGEIGTRWTVVAIPLSAFGEVQDMPLENVTFFASGDTAGIEPQRFYVAEIRFY